MEMIRACAYGAKFFASLEYAQLRLAPHLLASSHAPP